MGSVNKVILLGNLGADRVVFLGGGSENSEPRDRPAAQPSQRQQPMRSAPPADDDIPF